MVLATWLLLEQYWHMLKTIYPSLFRFPYLFTVIMLQRLQLLVFRPLEQLEMLEKYPCLLICFRRIMVAKIVHVAAPAHDQNQNKIVLFRLAQKTMIMNIFLHSLFLETKIM